MKLAQLSHHYPHLVEENVRRKCQSRNLIAVIPFYSVRDTTLSQKVSMATKAEQFTCR